MAAMIIIPGGEEAETFRLAEEASTASRGSGILSRLIANVGDETGSVRFFGGSGAETDDPLMTVRHYTSDLGRSQIEEAGSLRPGTYVTLPSEVPPGTSSEGVEKLLEIEAGKGANYVDVQVPSSLLEIPENGPVTSGGAWQRALRNTVDLGGSEFEP